MNMIKKNGGFTLVELIVVIAILAILAGVAVPAYSGYITKAKEASDYTMLDSVKTAIVFAAMDENAEAVVESADVTFASLSAVTVTGDNVDGTVDISEYFPEGLTSKSGAVGATWDGVEWELTKPTTP